MNELITVNFDTQTVSARELHERLNKLNDFKEFFIEVSKMKISMEFEELKILQKVVKSFNFKFGNDAVIYLSDSISAEIALPFNSLEARKASEQEMKEQIVNNFNSIFPDYTFVCCEKQVGGIGRIDIYALYGDRSVIIELKTGNKNPNTQLLAYGSKFENPILIGITEQDISDERKIEGITYFIFSELKKGVEQWII